MIKYDIHGSRFEMIVNPFDTPPIITDLTINNDSLLIGTLNNGLYGYNIKDTSIIKYNRNSKYSIPGNHIARAYTSKNGQLWVSAYAHGISCTYSLKNITLYMKNEQVRSSLQNNIVNVILKDADKHLWFATAEGASRYNVAKKIMTIIK